MGDGKCGEVRSNSEDQRSLHHDVDQLAPEPGLDLFAGFGLLQSVRPASSVDA